MLNSGVFGVACLVISYCSCLHLFCQPLKQLTYLESDEIFVNPERGWFAFRNLSEYNNFAIRAGGRSLIYYRIVASDFKEAPFSQSFLDEIQAGFDAARQNGVKVNPRVTYNTGPESGCPAEYGCDAPKPVILNHIKQLGPLWQSNIDVINLVDPGFIGGWGEWHTSSNGLDNPQDMKEILFAILEALPANRMVYVRYPAFKREMFGGSKTAPEPVLDSDSAFSGSHFARIGHLNDCFVSGEDDVGTYQYGWSREQNLDYIGAESAFTPFGGETCAVHSLGNCSNTLIEMEKLHINHLNQDYHPDVIQRWKDEGCYDEISRRLGYRFVLRTASLPDSVQPGGTLQVEFTISNVGFGELFNPRDVEVVLFRVGGEVASTPLSLEPRFWSAGGTFTVSTSLSIPIDIQTGNYSVGIRLPDKSASLHDDFRYAVRFANQDVWSELHGTNVLLSDFFITEDAPGEVNPEHTDFLEIGGGTPIKSPGKLSEDLEFSVKNYSEYIEITLKGPPSHPVVVKLLGLDGKIIQSTELAGRTRLKFYRDNNINGLYIIQLNIGSGSRSKRVKLGLF